MQANPISRLRRWATLATCCLAVLLLAIDLTVMYLAIPALIQDLEPSATQILWIADAYGFALGGLLITMGSVGDRIGRRRLLLIGAVGFGFASLATAYAASPELLIAARALLGVAGATIMPSTLSIIRNTFTDARERTTAVGVWGGVSAAGFAVGPIIGGLLLDRFWWGSVFLINLPVMAVVFVAAVLVMPESRNPRPGRLDVVSVPLSIIGVVALVYAIKDAADAGLDQVDVLIAASTGIVGLALFSWRQTRLEHPLIDVRIFRRRAFSGSVIASAVSTFSLAGLLLNLSQFFQFVQAWSPLKTGLAMLPVAAGAMIAGLAAGAVVSLVGRAWAVTLGLAVAAAGVAILSSISVDSSYPTLGSALFVLGIGFGTTFTVTADTVLATVPPERAGAAAAISETAYEVGGALGIAVLGSIMTRAYRNSLDLPPTVPPEVANPVRESIGAATGVIRALPEEFASLLRSASAQAFTDGFGITAVIDAIIVAVAALLAVITLRGVPKVINEPGSTSPDTTDKADVVEV
jgi:DHA2 family multidrug resistance protein-like MFS transporter